MLIKPSCRFWLLRLFLAVLVESHAEHSHDGCHDDQELDHLFCNVHDQVTLVIGNVARIDHFQTGHIDCFLHFGLFDSEQNLFEVLIQLKNKIFSWFETALLDDSTIQKCNLQLKIQQRGGCNNKLMRTRDILDIGNGIASEDLVEEFLNLIQQLISNIDILIKPLPHFHGKRQGALLQCPINILHDNK